MAFSSFLHNYTSQILLSWGWRANLTAFLAGLVCAFSLPPFDFWPLAFLGFVIFTLVLDGGLADSDLRTARQRFFRGFVRGWWFGFGYFLSSLWWVATSFLVDGGLLLVALPFATVILPMGLAGFTGFGAGLSALLWRNGPNRLFALAFGLGLSELLRGTMLTGFPWNFFGMAAMPDVLAMQTVSVLGIYGVTALAVFVFASPVLLLKIEVQPRKLANRLVGGLALFLVVAHLTYGFHRLSTTTIAAHSNTAIRVVQANINQSDKWDPEFGTQNFTRYLEMSDRATSPETIGVESFTHIIWPETALPFVLTERADAIAALADLLPDETVLITGAVRKEPAIRDGDAPFYYNSVYALNGQAEVIAAQDKVRLVPFGEFIPLTGFLDLFDSAPQAWKQFGFSAGNSHHLMSVPNSPSFLALICYEVIFPGIASEGGERPDWLVNVTNDAWFGHTPGPYQHLRLAHIRAVLEGLPIVRAANTGISALIDPTGRIVVSLPLGEQGVLDHGLPRPLPPTHAQLMGHFTVTIILFGLFFLSMVRLSTFGPREL